MCLVDNHPDKADSGGLVATLSTYWRLTPGDEQLLPKITPGSAMLKGGLRFPNLAHLDSDGQ